MTDGGERVGEVFGFRAWEGNGGVKWVWREVDESGEFKVIHLGSVSKHLKRPDIRCRLTARDWECSGENGPHR